MDRFARFLCSVSLSHCACACACEPWIALCDGDGTVPCDIDSYPILWMWNLIWSTRLKCAEHCRESAHKTKCQRLCVYLLACHSVKHFSKFSLSFEPTSFIFPPHSLIFWFYVSLYLILRFALCAIFAQIVCVHSLRCMGLTVASLLQW